MKLFFSILIVFLIGIICRAEVTTEKPREVVNEDLNTAETIGFGFYAGGYPFGGYYGGYPYYGYPHRKFFGIGYPYYGIRAYPAAPALPIWG